MRAKTTQESYFCFIVGWFPICSFLKMTINAPKCRLQKNVTPFPFAYKIKQQQCDTGDDLLLEIETHSTY